MWRGASAGSRATRCKSRPNHSPRHSRRLTIDHFKALGIKPTFDINSANLKTEYRARIQKCHPDVVANKPDDERRRAEDDATALTTAYAVLGEPQLRGAHLLELVGRPLGEDDDASLLGVGFLGDVMEVREELESQPSDEELGVLRSTNRDRMDTLVKELSAAFAAEEIDEARVLVAKLRYLRRIEEEIHEQSEV